MRANVLRGSMAQDMDCDREWSVAGEGIDGELKSPRQRPQDDVSLTCSSVELEKCF